MSWAQDGEILWAPRGGVGVWEPGGDGGGGVWEVGDLVVDGSEWVCGVSSLMTETNRDLLIWRQATSL